MENKQKALDSLLEALNECSAQDQRYNHIIALKLIDRKGCKDMFGMELPDGKYVRIVWSDNPDRNDGYYDICVEGNNTMGTLCDVFHAIEKIF